MFPLLCVWRLGIVISQIALGRGGGGTKQTRKSASWAPPYHPASGSNLLRAPCCTLLPAATFLTSPDLERDRLSEKTICSPSFLITESPLGLKADFFAHPKGLRISENL